MSRMAEKLAAALSGLSPETKAALAALLSADKPAVARKARGGKTRDLLLDKRTVAELWLSGESPEARNRAEARAAKGDYRSIVVTFADGFTVRAGSYLADDEFAKAAAIRSARARAMEREFARAQAAWQVECERLWRAYWSWRAALPADERDLLEEPELPVAPHPFRWAVVNGAHVARTRACEVPAVVSAEFVPLREPAPQLVQIGEQFLPAEGEFCAVDFDKLRKRAAHEARIADCTARYEQRRARLLPVPLAFTPCDLAAAFAEVSTPAADSAQTAVEARTEATAESAAETATKPASLATRQLRGGNRPSRGAGDYAVHTSSGFVLFVGSHRDAKKAAARTPNQALKLSICRLPTGWRERSVNVPFFANAKAWCDGTRQRINLSVVAA